VTTDNFTCKCSDNAGLMG